MEKGWTTKLLYPYRAAPCRAAPRRVYNVLLKNRWDSKEVTRSTIGLRRVCFSLTGNMYVRSSKNIRALYRLVHFYEQRFQKRRLLLFSNPFSSINRDSSESNLEGKNREEIEEESNKSTLFASAIFDSNINIHTHTHIYHIVARDSFEQAIFSIFISRKSVVGETR